MRPLFLRSIAQLIALVMNYTPVYSWLLGAWATTGVEAGAETGA
ncbi:MAG: hypothetical protein RBS80_19685 [Thermoguttaceae bacterium]|nr:hypothetical protein [Thermoguttaceae bacterium]